MSEPESRFYDSGRLRLHYAMWGDEAKPPLVLVHGGRDHARSWDFVAQALADRYCVYAADLRGHGDSDWQNSGHYSFIDNVLDLAKLVDVIGRFPVTLMGHSRGGGIVLEYAGTYPDNMAHVIAIEGLGPRGMTHRPANERMRAFIEQMWEMEDSEQRFYPAFEEALARMKEANPRLSPEMVLHLTTHAVKRHENGSYVWKFDHMVRARSPYEWNSEDARVIWNAIRCPVLLIRGSERNDQDPMLGRRDTAFHRLRSERLENAGHWVHHDQFDRMMAIVNDFLADGA